MARQIDNLNLVVDPESKDIYLAKLNKDGSMHKTVRRKMTKDTIITMFQWFLGSGHNMLSISEDNGNPIKMYLSTDEDSQQSIENKLDISNDTKSIK